MSGKVECTYQPFHLYIYTVINTFENFEGTTKMFNLFNNVGVIALPFNLL